MLALRGLSGSCTCIALEKLNPALWAERANKAPSTERAMHHAASRAAKTLQMLRRETRCEPLARHTALGRVPTEVRRRGR